MGLKVWKILVTAVFVSVVQIEHSFAQDNDSGPHQAGFFIGRVLPNNVTAEDEIFTLWGLRYGLPASDTSYYDFTGFFGNNEGVKWQGGAASIRMNIPVETLIGHAGVGADFTRFETATEGAKNEFGAHFIGGVMMSIGGNALFRFDMKLNSKPGTSLYFAMGITINLEEGEGGAN